MCITCPYKPTSGNAVFAVERHRGEADNLTPILLITYYQPGLSFLSCHSVPLDFVSMSTTRYTGNARYEVTLNVEFVLFGIDDTVYQHRVNVAVTLFLFALNNWYH